MIQTFRCMALLAVLVFAGLTAAPPAMADISEGAERIAAEKAWNEADALLNAGYKKALSVLLDAEERTKLQEEQRAWVKMRDAQAEREAIPVKGSNYYNMVRHDALRRITIERYATLLNIYYDSYAVDLYRDQLNESQEE